MLAPLQRRQIRPQPGPQENFLSTSADIAIFGGAAFAGKTFALLLEAARHTANRLFAAVIFRRETPQITNPGALWDESMKIYPSMGADPVPSRLEYKFPSGAKVKFAHLEHVDDVVAWDGSQVPLFGFDQLEHFERSQFFYMLSRNRSDSGVSPYIRGTCNPNADSWLAEFLAWWIDQGTGFPIPERAGILRWFVRDGDLLVWADSREELLAADPESDPKSVTFIPGTIFDNKIGMMNDPKYLGNLKALARVERERLLGGNWKIRPAAGLLFQREWCPALDIAPENAFEAVVRGWDLAATQKTENNSPAWTVGVKIGRYRHTKRYAVLDARRAQVSPAKVEELILRAAQADGRGVAIAIRQDPGQAGKAQVATLVKLLAGFTVHSSSETGDKATRFGPFSAQCEHGNVDIVRGAWYDPYCTSLESFPDGKVKDDADASSTAFERLCQFSGAINVAAGSEVSDTAATGTGDGAPWGMYDRM